MAHTTEAFALQIRLMAKEAATRLADGAILSSKLAGAGSDSAYLLELLAFELLLKAALRINEVTPRPNHSYSKLFTLLPTDVQTRVRDAASGRTGPDGDFSNLATLLDTWGRNFVALRYPYEKYEGLTEDEYRARGQAWLNAGASESTADFAYYPTELHGLAYALRAEVDAWLRNHSPEP